MSEENPFAPPAEAFDVAEDTLGQFVLADRSTRFVAALLDGFLAMAYTIPLMMTSGVFEEVQRGRTPIAEMVGVAVISWVILLVLHGYFLAANGQTLGNKLLGIRIADMEGKNPGPVRIFFGRMLPTGLLTYIPTVGNFIPMIDALFIFNSERRCLHDSIAGTQVLKV